VVDYLVTSKCVPSRIGEKCGESLGSFFNGCQERIGRECFRPL